MKTTNRHRVKYIAIISISMVVLVLYFNISRRYSFACKDSFDKVQANKLIADLVGRPMSVKWGSFDETIDNNGSDGFLWHFRYVVKGKEKSAQVNTDLRRKSSKEWVYEKFTVKIGVKEFNLAGKSLDQ